MECTFLLKGYTSSIILSDFTETDFLRFFTHMLAFKMHSNFKNKGYWKIKSTCKIWVVWTKRRSVLTRVAYYHFHFKELGKST